VTPDLDPVVKRLIPWAPQTGGAVTQFRSLWNAEGYRRPLARVCMASRNSRNKGS